MKPFTKIGSVIFSVIALLHAARLVKHWEVSVGGYLLPVWLSALLLMITAVMAWGLWKESK